VARKRTFSAKSHVLSIDQNFQHRLTMVTTAGQLNNAQAAINKQTNKQTSKLTKTA
jgi:hypothetical protein